MRTNRGAGWEALLDAQHTEYRRDRRAVVHKTHPPAKLIRGRLVHTAKGAVDFIGCLEGGRAVALDAKEGRGGRWPFSSLKRHQAVDLEAWTDRGALAGIALRLLAGAWWVPWSALGPLWWDKDGRRSVDVAWLDEHTYAMDGADWLEAALQ